jgi:hypothetical protein
MSKRHQASRRRSYGRRQHDLHERIEHAAAAAASYLIDPGSRESEMPWRLRPLVGGRMIPARGRD